MGKDSEKLTAFLQKHSTRLAYGERQLAAAVGALREFNRTLAPAGLRPKAGGKGQAASGAAMDRDTAQIMRDDPQTTMENCLAKLLEKHPGSSERQRIKAWDNRPAEYSRKGGRKKSNHRTK